MQGKFIPNGDFDFAIKAEHFAKRIADEPGQFEIASGDVEALSAAVARFRERLNQYQSGTHTEAARQAKTDARAEAVSIMRRMGHLLRTNVRIDAATRITLGIKPRANKLKKLTCPQEPPRLWFVQAHHLNSATPMHELAFRALDHHSKPEGAMRLELFVDLVPPSEPIPAYPGANHAGRPWYLRSYTRSPIKFVPPIPRVAMRVLYWGRWADSAGNVGPFSETAVAWTEGGSHRNLPGAPAFALEGLRNGPKPVKILEDASGVGRVDRDESYTVALLEVRYGTMTEVS